MDRKTKIIIASLVLGFLWGLLNLFTVHCPLNIAPACYLSIIGHLFRVIVYPPGAGLGVPIDGSTTNTLSNTILFLYALPTFVGFHFWSLIWESINIKGGTTILGIIVIVMYVISLYLVQIVTGTVLGFLVSLISLPVDFAMSIIRRTIK